MHALFFEVRPKPGHLQHYFDHVDRLRPVLARHDGLEFLERYRALEDPDVLLSHQLWRDEAAILAWRRDAAHRRSQTAGRNVHFSDYRIRVGARVAHWQAGAGTGTAADGAAADRAHLLVLYGTRPVEAPGAAGFESVTRPGHFVTLAPAGDMAAAEALLDAHAGQPGLTEAATIRISRDYGMHDRAEAPEPAG
jgi:heme-degrading monooxygenase HmoA